MDYAVKGEVPDGEYAIPFGVADVKRAGEDVTIVATSSMVRVALAAAELLEADGISAEVVDPAHARPARPRHARRERPRRRAARSSSTRATAATARAPSSPR